METYDPRNPIVKATEEDESAEVEGHRFIAKQDGPVERVLRATESDEPEVEGHGDMEPNERIVLRANDDDETEVEGHRFIAKQDGPDERIVLRANDDDETEVEGHRFIAKQDGPDERIVLRATDDDEDEVEGHGFMGPNEAHVRFGDEQ